MSDQDSPKRRTPRQTKTTKRTTRRKPLAHTEDQAMFEVAGETFALNPGQAELLLALAYEHGADMVIAETVTTLEARDTSVLQFVAYQLKRLVEQQRRLEALFGLESAS